MNSSDLFNEIIVRMEGLEPPRREASDPKSDASTNSATSAKKFSTKVFKNFNNQDSSGEKLTI